MHPASTTSLSRTQESAIDVLLTLAHICLNGAGRLMALNSTVDKEALFDGATMARALAGVTTTAALHEIQGDLAGPMLEKTLAYHRNLRDVAAQAQDELARVLADAFRAPGIELPLPAPWLDLMASFAATSPTVKAQVDRRRAAA
jgi:phasin family protein